MRHSLTRRRFLFLIGGRVPSHPFGLESGRLNVSLIPWLLSLASTHACGIHQGDKMLALLRAIWLDDTGATAIEYGLIAALIAVVLISTVRTVGTNLKTTFSTIGNAL